MNVNCVICSDLLGPSDEIYATRCGHAFHQTCLLQWMERSKTCPQCRARISDKAIFRIYFNYLNTAGITLDAGSLQVKLDNVEFQLKEKNRDIAQHNQELLALKDRLIKSEETVSSTKELLKSKEQAISGLKGQVDYYKIQSKEVTGLRNEKEQLQKSLDLLKGLDQIMHGTANDVEEMMKGQNDIPTMCTYIIALKRASSELHTKKKRLSENLRALQNQLSKCNIQKIDHESKIRTLEESFSHSEEEIKQLKSQVSKLEALLQDKSDEVNDSNTPDKTISPYSKLKRKSKRKCDFQDSSPPKARKMCADLLELDMIDPSNDSPRLNTEDTTLAPSPYIILKQNNPLTSSRFKQLAMSETPGSEFSIFKNSIKLLEKNKLENSLDQFKAMHKSKMERQTDYDGLGGHSKLDIFPTVTPPPSKLALSKERRKRLKKPTNQTTIDSILNKI